MLSVTDLRRGIRIALIGNYGLLSCWALTHSLVWSGVAPATESRLPILFLATGFHVGAACALHIVFTLLKPHTDDAKSSSP